MRLTISQHNLFLFLLTSLFIIQTGCSSLTNQILKDPVVTIKSVSITDMTLEEMTLGFDLNVENPNSIPLSLKEVDYNLNFAGESVAKGVFENSIDVPANGNNHVIVPMTFKYNAIGTLLSNVFTKSLTKSYELSGSAKMGLFKIPFSKKGEITIKK